MNLVLGSALNLIKYTIEGILPYDLSKIEEIIKMQSSNAFNSSNSNTTNINNNGERI